MFNENDLRAATERLKDMARTADRARMIKHIDASNQRAKLNHPLWVRVLSAALDHSRWTLVPKSDFASQRVAQAE